MRDYQRIVNFDEWCNKCKRKDVSESPKTAEESKEYEICNECLTVGARDDGSSRPINFEEE